MHVVDTDEIHADVVKVFIVCDVPLDFEHDVSKFLWLSHVNNTASLISMSLIIHDTHRVGHLSSVHV